MATVPAAVVATIDAFVRGARFAMGRNAAVRDRQRATTEDCPRGATNALCRTFGAWRRLTPLAETNALRGVYGVVGALCVDDVLERTGE